MSDRGEIVKILVISVVCVVIGFTVTYMLFKPTPPTVDTTAAAVQSPPAQAETPPSTVKVAPPAAQGSYAPAGSGEGYAPAGSGAGYAPTPGASPAAAPAAAGQPAPQGAPPVPPGRTPGGVSIDGNAFYVKCWDSSGSEFREEDCGRVRLFEKRFSTRLYVVDRCKKEHAGEASKGKLSLGIKVNFPEQALTFWSGKSSDLDNAQAVAKCLRSELAGLPLSNITHSYDRYQLFYTILFEDASAPSAPTRRVKGGKPRKVAQDRVRVRKSPKTGEIIGLISAGNEVQLLKKDGDWCEIITPNNNRGWMICEALSK